MVTQRGLEGLGNAVHRGFNDTTPERIVGDRINRALRAALKATTLDDKHIDMELTKARRAFVRQLRRMGATA